jgi:hypothetical protein
VARIDALALRHKLPKQYGSLRDYTRYYWGVEGSGHRVVDGFFMAPRMAKEDGLDATGQIHIVRERVVPAFKGGGCWGYSVEFDVPTGKIGGSCNADR